MTTIQPKRINTRVVTGEVRLSYAHVWEPRPDRDGEKPKYGVSVLIPKTDTATVAAIQEAIDAAYQSGVAKFGGKLPPLGGLKTPLRDGDVERDDETYHGHWFINANSTTAPQIVDAQARAITNHDEVYSGCYGRVSINFFPYNTNGNRGIGAALGNIQKLRDGEKLAGGPSAQDDFGAPQDVADDFLS